jgi:hypothetical protein
MVQPGQNERGDDFKPVPRLEQVGDICQRPISCGLSRGANSGQSTETIPYPINAGSHVAISGKIPINTSRIRLMTM